MSGSLRVAAISADVDAAFWVEVGRLKLEVYKLSQDVVPITAYMSIFPTAQPSYLINEAAFAGPSQKGFVRIRGDIVMFNTIEEYKAACSQEFLHSKVQELVQATDTEKNAAVPPELINFHVICYADLKTFQFYYWSCLPTASVPIEMTDVSAASATIGPDVSDGPHGG
jgi:ubiquitin-like modifier-activating enzyme ATG7